MKVRLVSGITLSLLLIGMLTSTFNFTNTGVNTTENLEPVGATNVSNLIAETSPQQCPPGMVSYWKFDEGNGLVAQDSADANDGDITGATWTTGIVDGALEFDGDDDYVRVPYDSSLAPTSEITLEAWIKISEDQASQHTNLISKAYTSYSEPYYDYVIKISYRRPIFNVITTTGENSLAGVNISYNEWNHITGTYNGSSAKIYINGTLINEKPATGTIVDRGQHLYMGRYQHYTTEGYLEFKGLADEIAIYDRALTPEEVQQHYQKGLIGLGYCEVEQWPMFRHDLYHTGYSTSTAPDTNNTIWSYTTDDGVISSPSVADGKVYVGGGWVVYCLNAATGAHMWNYTTGGGVFSSPAVADGKVYVGSLDTKVYCLNASTGASIWNYTTGGSVFSSPAVADGIVYIGSDDYNIYALNATTGAEIWHYTTGGIIQSSQAVSGGRVYALSADDRVYCLNASTGASIWDYTEYYVRSFSSPAVADGKVYIGSINHSIYALNATTGTKIWNYTTDGDVHSSPAVADGKVYVGSLDTKVYCLNASTGASIWNYTTGVPVLSSPAVADGKVYIGTGLWTGEPGSMVIAFGAHDVAITNVKPHKTVVCQNHTMYINVISENQGDYSESFNVTAYYNSNEINHTTVADLPPHQETTVTIPWNTTGIPKGNYTIKARITPLPSETDIVDNNFTDGWVIVSMEGDITGPDKWPDGKCDIRDIAAVAILFGVNHPDPRYDPNCDLTGSTPRVADGKIDIKDIAAVAIHYGEVDP